MKWIIVTIKNDGLVFRRFCFNSIFKHNYLCIQFRFYDVDDGWNWRQWQFKLLNLRKAGNKKKHRAPMLLLMHKISAKKFMKFRWAVNKLMDLFQQQQQNITELVSELHWLSELKIVRKVCRATNWGLNWIRQSVKDKMDKVKLKRIYLHIWLGRWVE